MVVPVVAPFPDSRVRRTPEPRGHRRPQSGSILKIASRNSMGSSRRAAGRMTSQDAMRCGRVASGPPRIARMRRDGRDEDGGWRGVSKEKDRRWTTRSRVVLQGVRSRWHQLTHKIASCAPAPQDGWKAVWLEFLDPWTSISKKENCRGWCRLL